VEIGHRSEGVDRRVDDPDRITIQWFQAGIALR
jgi:hypothetical protein